jgi:hypothetical protein
MAAPADGTTSVQVSGSGTGAVDSVVQRTENRVRHMSVLRDDAAPTSYRYGLAGAEFALGARGSVVIEDAASGEVIGTVEAPWAVDDNGARVPTAYSVDDDGRLVQTTTAATGRPPRANG